MSISVRHRRARWFAVPSAPVAAFSVSAAAGGYPKDVTFTNTSTGNPYDFSWDFGNGTTATGPGPHVVTYADIGPYTVSLTARTGGGSHALTKPVLALSGFASFGSVAGGGIFPALSRAAGLLFQDYPGMTTPATANGTGVAAVVCPFTGRVFFNDSGNALTYFALTDEGGDKWSLASGGSSYLTTSFGGVVAGPWSMGIAVNQTNDSSFLCDGIDVTNRVAMGMTQNDGKMGIYAGAVLEAVRALPDKASWVGVTGASGVLERNGAAFASGNVGTLGLAGLTIGARYALDFGFIGRFYAGIPGNAAWGAAERAAVATLTAGYTP